MIDSRGIAGNLGKLAWHAAKSFLGTLVAMLMFGAALAAASYWCLRAQPAGATIGAVLAMFEAAAAGTFLAGKRAIATACIHGVQSFSLGGLVARSLFERLANVAGDVAGGSVAESLRRLPLDQAQQKLRQLADGLLAQQTNGGITGWLRRRLFTKVLTQVEAFSLARFRSEDDSQQGLDLAKIQSELETQIDSWLIARLRKGIGWITITIAVGLPLLVVGQTWYLLTLQPPGDGARGFNSYFGH